jgi:dipeptidyl-peptidase 4
VASAPATDPYNDILYEPYLDLPSRSKAAYDYAGLYPLAGQITGKLMLMAGTSDPICHSSTMKMVHYLIEAGVDHDLVVFPEGYHGFLGGKDEEYFVHKLVGHFERYLRPTVVQ